MKKVVIILLTLVSSYLSIAQSITIDNISKKTTFSGDKLVISGSGFDANSSNLKVTFGAVGSNIISSTLYQIEVRVPKGATYDNIIVHNLSTGLSAASNALFLLAYGGRSFDPNKMSEITDFTTQNGLYDLCLCDFNNDGKVDIATANTASNSITLLTNTSSGIGDISFSRSPVLVNAETLNIQCADLNNDGKSEILLSKTGTVSNVVYYLENTSSSGSISFASPIPLNLEGSTARRVEVADLNLDGKPDVIATNQTNNKVNIFKNTSTSSTISFDPTPMTFEVAGISNSAGLKVKDLNNDGYPDIAMAPYLSSNIYVLKNVSNTNTIIFDNASTVSVPGTIVNLEIGDINGDQKPDLITTKLSGNNISIIQNTSANNEAISFGTKKDVATAQRPWGIGLGDFNGDGKLDISVTSINETSRFLNVLINKSTSSSVDFNNYEVTTNEKAQNIKVGDLDGDGKPEIALTGIDNEMISEFSNKHCLVPTIFGDLSRTLCDGGELGIRTSGGPGATYKWFKSDGATEWEVKNSSEPFYSEVVNTSGTFTYRVEAVQGSCNESSPESMTLEVIGGAVSTITGIENLPPVCEGNDFTLTAQGDFASLPASATFIWTKPDNSTVNTTTPNLDIPDASTSDVGEYKVKLEVGTCISNEVGTNVQVVVTTSVNIEASNGLSFCSGLNSTLSVPQVTTNSYKWYKNNVVISAATTYKYVVSQSGEYRVEIQTAAGCDINPNSVTVDAYGQPTAEFTVANESCTGQEVTFDNSSIVKSGVSVEYQWNFGDGQSSTDENPTHTYSQTGPFTITLTTSYDATCKDIIQKDINIKEGSLFSITSEGSTSFCEGDELKITAPEGFESYSWNDSQNSASAFIMVSETGTYSVTVTNSNGCESSNEIDIEVFPSPEISIEIESIDGKTFLMATGASRYEWDANTTLLGSDVANPEVIPEVTTSYMVTGYDINECSSTAEITVEINPSDAFGKIFTPNNDGENDVWVVKNIQQYENCTISVFNRSGQVVFEKKNYNNDWDGTLNGRDLQEGVYYFMVKCDDDSKSLTGSVTIFR